MERTQPFQMVLLTGEGHRIRIRRSTASFRHRPYFAHKHSDFEISYVLAGSGNYRIEGEDCRFAGGDIFVFGTNEVHCITDTYGDEPLVLCNIQFEPRLLWSPRGYGQDPACIEIFTRRAPGAGSRLAEDGAVRDRIIRLILDIFREAEEERPARELMVQALFMQLLAEMVRGHRTEGERASLFPRQSRLMSMDRAVNYIEEHLSEPITLEEIAREAGVSRTYFSTLFRTLNGLSPWDYILIRRVDTAKHLLATTDETVLDVCGNAGFENISHFNRVFLRYAGCTPHEYRAAHKT